MELRVLRYFLAVAQEKNITRAAEVLHLTQPTLSRQMNDLEQEMGAVLFRREGRMTVLTADGALLKKYAEEIIELADKLQRDFNARGDGLQGTVSLGCVEAKGSRLLMAFIKYFHEKYPEVKFDLYNSYADDIKDRLDKGLIDIGLLLEPVDVARYDYVRLETEEVWGILVNRNNPLAAESSITLKMLESQNLIIPQRAATRQEILSWLGCASGRYQIFATYTLLSNAVLMVEQDLGCAVCLDGAIGIKDNGYVRFIPLSPLKKSGSLLVWKKNNIFNSAASLFIKIISKTDLNAFEAL